MMPTLDVARIKTARFDAANSRHVQVQDNAVVLFRSDVFHRLFVVARVSDFIALSHERRFEDVAYLCIVINDQESSSTHFVDLPAESECLPLELLAPMIDDSEHA